MNTKSLLLIGGIALVVVTGTFAIKSLSQPQRQASFNRAWGMAYYGSDSPIYRGESNTAWGPGFYGGFGNGVQMQQKAGNIWTPSLLEGR